MEQGAHRSHGLRLLFCTKNLSRFICANISSPSSFEISILPNHSGAFMPA